MAKTHKTEKSVEIHEFYVIRTSGSLPALCVECGTGDAIMVPAEQAALVAHVPARTIYRWIEIAAIHYKEETGRAMMVCLKSLPATADHITSMCSADQSENGD